MCKESKWNTRQWLIAEKMKSDQGNETQSRVLLGQGGSLCIFMRWWVLTQLKMWPRWQGRERPHGGGPGPGSEPDTRPPWKEKTARREWTHCENPGKHYLKGVRSTPADDAAGALLLDCEFLTRMKTNLSERLWGVSWHFQRQPKRLLSLALYYVELYLETLPVQS